MNQALSFFSELLFQMEKTYMQMDELHSNVSKGYNRV